MIARSPTDTASTRAPPPSCRSSTSPPSGSFSRARLEYDYGRLSRASRSEAVEVLV
jgi:hypothetical protein